MKKLVSAACLGFMLLFSLGACDEAANDGEPAAGPAYDLVVGVMPSMDYLPLAVAQREGYFRQVGLNLKIIKFYSANERDAAFQSGNIDGTVIDFTGALLQKNGGADLKITSSCDAPFYIVSSKKTPVIDVVDLKGAKVAVSRNTVIDYCVDMALKSAGLSPGDITKVELNKIPLRYEMLRKGEVDATGLPSPLALMAAFDGNRIITSNRQLGFAITGIMFSQQAIDEKEPFIRKLYQAYNMSVDYLQRHEIANISDILKNELGFTDEVLPLAAVSDYTRAKMPAAEDVRQAADWLSAQGLLPPGFPVEGVLDDRFTRR